MFGEAVKLLDRLAPNLVGTNLQIHLGMAKYNSPFNTPVGFRGVKIQKSWEAVKQLDRLAPELVHLCGFVWEWTQANYNSPLNILGAFWWVLGGHKFKSMLKLSNGWTDWHQIGTRVQIHLGMDIRQTNCPSRHKGGTWGFRGQTFKSLEKLSNGWTDW